MTSGSEENSIIFQLTNATNSLIEGTDQDQDFILHQLAIIGTCLLEPDIWDYYPDSAERAMLFVIEICQTFEHQTQISSITVAAITIASFSLVEIHRETPDLSKLENAENPLDEKDAKICVKNIFESLSHINHDAFFAYIMEGLLRLQDQNRVPFDNTHLKTITDIRGHYIMLECLSRSPLTNAQKAILSKAQSFIDRYKDPQSNPHRDFTTSSSNTFHSHSTQRGGMHQPFESEVTPPPNDHKEIMDSITNHRKRREEFAWIWSNAIIRETDRNKRFKYLSNMADDYKAGKFGTYENNAMNIVMLCYLSHTSATHENNPVTRRLLTTRLIKELEDGVFSKTPNIQEKVITQMLHRCFYSHNTEQNHALIDMQSAFKNGNFSLSTDHLDMIANFLTMPNHTQSKFNQKAKTLAQIWYDKGVANNNAQAIPQNTPANKMVPK